jgi:hypothetical protein
MHSKTKRPLLIFLSGTGLLCLCLAWFLGLLHVFPEAKVKRIGVAEWQPRDSAGEFVYKGKLWILGGWKTDPPALLRDVWNSADGVKWNLVQPKLPFDYTDLPMTIVFKDKMWVLGGNRLSDPVHPTSNAVWNSEDGIQWTKVQEASAWSPRTATPIVEWNGKLWILGGKEVANGKSIYKNDVWSSSDGINWEKVTEHAAWQPRAYHKALAYKGKLWVMGGGSYAPDFIALNDVWNSDDGVTWTKVSDAPWHGRIWFSGVVYRDLMWVIGGWSKKTLNLKGIWYSDDGIKWTRSDFSEDWRGRHEASTYVFNDKIIVAGGHADPVTNEVWALDIPTPTDGQ